jgi:hypothetical protein
MKNILAILSLLLIVSKAQAWDLKVVGGEPVCIECETYVVHNATYSYDTTVVVDSAPLTALNSMRADGFVSASRSEWLKELNLRLDGKVSTPSTEKQLDALWKIVNGKNDPDSEMVNKAVSGK